MLDQSTKHAFHTLTPMQIAMVSAILLHLLILTTLPAIDSWQLPFLNQGLRLNVELQLDEESFDQRLQSLDNTNANTANTQMQIRPQRWGEEDVDQAASSNQPGNPKDQVQSSAVGQSERNSLSIGSIFSQSALKKFAQIEAVRFADAHPEKVARFNRSFRSQPRVQQRKRSQYRNQYGDTYFNNPYLKKQGSPGDICFVKTAEPFQGPAGTQDAPTYTVHFFRCDSATSKR